MPREMTFRERLNFVLTGSKAGKAIIFKPGTTPEWSKWDMLKAIEEGYKTNTYFFSANNIIVRNIGSVIFMVEKKQADGSFLIDKEHPVNKIISRPNPQMNFATLIKASIIYLNVGGNYVWYKVRDGNEVINWNLLPLNNIKPIQDKMGFISHYEYTVDGKVEIIQTTDIIHGREFNPADANWGLSKLAVLARTVDMDNAAVNWQKVSMDNQGVPSGIFSTDTFMNEEQFNSTKEIVSSEYANKDNARAPWVMGGGMKWYPMSMTPLEADYLNSRKFNREEISAVMGVPLPLLGVAEHSTMNNLDQYKKSLWEETIIPTLDEICDTVTFDWQTEYGGEIRLSYDLSGITVLRDDLAKKVEIASKKADIAIKLNRANLTPEAVNELLAKIMVD